VATSAQHADLVTKHQDLDIFGCVGSGERRRRMNSTPSLRPAPPCVNAAVADYLINLRASPAGTRCTLWRPVWFEATAEGTIQVFTGPDTTNGCAVPG
jgi:hypothetical protein